jgi:DNA transposition AAA+ family ATPase
MDHVPAVTEYIQALADIAAVQVAPDRVADVIERVGRRHTVRHAGVLDAVRGPPGEVDVVRLDLEQSVLHVVLVDQDRALGVAEFGKPSQAAEVPVVEGGEVVAR